MGHPVGLIKSGSEIKLVLNDAIFLATCLASLQKEIHYKLQETCCTLQSRVPPCNGSKKSLPSLRKVEPSSTFYNRCKPKNVARKVAKRACYALQSTCNLSCSTIGTQVAKKIASCNNSLRKFWQLWTCSHDFGTTHCPGVNFASVHGLTPLTVHTSFSLP